MAHAQLSPHQSPRQSEPESMQPKKKPAAQGQGCGEETCNKGYEGLEEAKSSPKEEKHNKTEKPEKTKKEQEEKMVRGLGEDKREDRREHRGEDRGCRRRGGYMR